MAQKHSPLRKCTGCGQMKAKSDLIRLVKIKDENNKDIKKVSIDIDFKKFGRGAYVCKNLDCLKICRKARRFERAFGCKIDDHIYDGLEELLKNE